jgi:hypothetical protein
MLCHVGSCELADWAIAAQDPGMLCSVRPDPLMNPGWRSSFGRDGSIPHGSAPQPGAARCSMRIWSKACLMRLFNIRFRETELHYRNFAAALAQFCNVGLSRNRMLKTESSSRSIA